jgi:TRAP-type C4-dicarboxylate transport system permease small subunit
MWILNFAAKFERLVYPLSLVLNGIGLFVLALMVLFITADTVLRYFFNSPIQNSYEVVELMMVFAFSLGIAYAQKHKSHVAVTLIVSKLSPRVQAIVDCFIYFIGIGFLGLMTWQIFVRARVVSVKGDISIGSLLGLGHVAIFPFYYVLALACTALTLVLLVDFLASLAATMKK